jgi:hypothetical protein
VVGKEFMKREQEEARRRKNREEIFEFSCMLHASRQPKQSIQLIGLPHSKLSEKKRYQCVII